MIKSYEIKNIEGEEVLILNLDLRVEFAKTTNNKKTTIEKEVNNYLKKNNIKFNGRKILILASGLLVTTLLLKSPIPKENITYNYASNLLTLKENIDLSANNPQNEILETIKKEEVLKVSTNKETTKNETKSPAKENKPQTSSKDSSTPTTKTPVKTETKPSSPASNTNPTKDSTNQVTAQNMIQVKRNNGTILNIELEEYLIGVVAAEMPASFNIEALKSQAIAARTYALKAKENGITLTDTTSTQVYKDNNELKKIWGNSYNTYYNKVKSAVAATNGLVMYYNNSLINAYYHSTSNGQTEDSKAVFGEYPYLKSVDSSVDKNVSSYLKTISLSYEEISNKLGIPLTQQSTIKIIHNESNRIASIIIDNNIYDGVKFRTILGLRSTDFDINLEENKVSITTRGFGHGVGMSQYGANEYAKKGWNYTSILKHYYTGITIKKY